MDGQHWRGGAWSGVVFLLACGAAWAQENAVYNELVGTGLKLGAVSYKFPAPTMPDGLDSTGQARALASIADDNHPVEALVRKSVVAPFTLKLGEPKADRPPTVDVYFVAHGDLTALTGDNFVRQFSGAGESGADLDSIDTVEANQSRLFWLTADDLKERRITPVSEGHATERYAHVASNLFDRVQFRRTTRSFETRSRESVLAASLVDARFADDPRYPNAWRTLVRGDQGNVQLGTPQKYAGAGSYVKATKLLEPAGALFVEYHHAYDEPASWFSGANLLRSKLPAIIQEAVRKLRRQAAGGK